MLLKEGTKTNRKFLHEFSPFFLHFQAFHSICQIKYTELTLRLFNQDKQGPVSQTMIRTAEYNKSR